MLFRSDRYGCKVVAVTLGAQGAVFCCANEVFLSPAFPVDVIDTTGAGDVFHGAYIYGLLQGWRTPETAQFANACAAMKCQCMGARTGIPNRPEVEKFLRARQKSTGLNLDYLHSNGLLH